MKKIVITNLRGRDILFSFDDDHEINTIKCIENTMVDNVYKGKIVEMNRGLNACFVSISPENKIFVPFSSFKYGNKPKCGDEIPVQIRVDALKTKLPEGDPNICLPGQYCVCHLNSNSVSVSKKLSKEVQNELLKSISESNVQRIEQFGWVIRTNSEFLLENGDISPLIKEMSDFIEKMSFIKDEAIHRSLYSVLYQRNSNIISIINNIPFDSYDSIVTDNKLFFDDLVLADIAKNKEIKLYSDEYVSLKNLHSLETYLSRALDKKVYLDCGGYLIIEPTEAMTVIDVNSGKIDSKHRESRETKFKVNKQAAIEVAKQLKIRNISGIVMVDFINMESEEDNQKLMEILSNEVRKDKVLTNIVDMTPLGIVEITRKKISSSLSSSLKENILDNDESLC